ncbi:sensor histidine kinase [Schumannella soli]|uniref:sensor histidine kinase n=1 Tax=Schumannella soli TaxID=2590779 RepID=UPI0015E8533F|nr:histidine kinase [Schumannella soli]
MTFSSRAADAIARANMPRSGGRSWLFSVIWGAVYALGLASMFASTHRAPWVWLACAVGVIGWILRALIPDTMSRRQLAAELGMIVVGGLVAFEANVLGGVPLAVGLVLVIGRLERPVRAGVVAFVLAVAALGAGLLLTSSESRDLGGVIVGSLAMLIISALVGVSRRQVNAAELRLRELAEQRRRAERLDDHARVARELHDVLAHGLGALVVQLDAVDALLESGRVDEAAARVRSSRTLAVDGLRDARRAVDALRSDETDAAPVSPEAATAALAELIEAHRALGGAVEARLATPPRALPASTATALRRILQEALSNARKHAAGQPVAVELRRVPGARPSMAAAPVAPADHGRLVLEVTNPLGAAGAAAGTGGGHGLAGMEERVSEIAGAELRTGVEGAGTRFMVRVEVPA